MKIFNTKDTRPKRKILRRNQTDAEKLMWQFLRDKQFKGLKFFRQYGIGGYIADFYCSEIKLVIELDGSSHFTEDGKEYDGERKKIMESMGIKTIRFNNHELLTGLDHVLAVIGNVVDCFGERPLTPSLTKRGDRKKRGRIGLPPLC